MPNDNPIDLLARTLFSETKSIDDAIAIAHVIQNRLARPKRFGDTYEKVIYAPKQFSGVGTQEWEKAEKKRFNQQERQIYEAFKNIALGVQGGVIPDPTGGADHYYNPEISNPSWGKIFPETYKTKFHRYLKETTKKKK